MAVVYNFAVTKFERQVLVVHSLTRLFTATYEISSSKDLPLLLKKNNVANEGV